MKKIIAVNASPRRNRNTAQLVRAAAEGAAEAGASAVIYNLYDLEKFTGCISCFGCKTSAHLGQCVCQDGLTPVLEAIREADGLIIGTPNYLGEASSGFRALYERLIFQYITYKKEFRSYNERKIPVLFIMTSNIGDDAYVPGGVYHDIVKQYQNRFNTFIGPCDVLIAADTKQVDDYSVYDWTGFDAEHKVKHHDEVFEGKKEEAKSIGRKMTEKV